MCQLDPPNPFDCLRRVPLLVSATERVKRAPILIMRLVAGCAVSQTALNDFQLKTKRGFDRQRENSAFK